MRSPLRLMSLRMVNYGGQALRDYVHREDAVDGHVPVLVPIVIVQSGRWTEPRQLSELHTLPGEPPPPRVYMDLEMVVHELHEDSLPAEELTTLARTTLGLLRLAAHNLFDDIEPDPESFAGRQQARGRAQMLLQMLEHRFGRLPAWVEPRMLAATIAQLDEWALRLLDAATLDEVWGDR